MRVVQSVIASLGLLALLALGLAAPAQAAPIFPDGNYKGTSSAGHKVNAAVKGSKIVAFNIQYDLPCRGGVSGAGGAGGVDVADDGTFVIDNNPGPISYRFDGKFTADGTASGTLNVTGQNLDPGGAPCSTPPLTWTAKRIVPAITHDTAVETAIDVPVSFMPSATATDDEPLYYWVEETAGGIGGAVTCAGEYGADCIYTPPAGAHGVATIPFQAIGSDMETEASGTVTVTVKAPVVLASLKVTASKTTVDQGGSVTLTAQGFAAGGAGLGDVTDDVTFSSDVDTDVVEGNKITFPHASPHTITATHVSGAKAKVLITVNPKPSTEPTPGDDSDDSDDEPSGDAEQQDGANNAGGDDDAALPDTGGTPVAALWTGALLLAAGVGTVLLGQYRRGQRRA